MAFAIGGVSTSSWCSACIVSSTSASSATVIPPSLVFWPTTIVSGLEVADEALWACCECYRDKSLGSSVIEAQRDGLISLAGPEVSQWGLSLCELRSCAAEGVCSEDIEVSCLPGSAIGGRTSVFLC